MKTVESNHKWASGPKTFYEVSYRRSRVSGRLNRRTQLCIDENPNSCPHCKSVFRCESALNIHILRHMGEKPFKCAHCSASFVLKSHLKYHTRKHTGEKPYKCSLCDSSFAHASSLKTHIRTHTGEKPYKCTYCGKMLRYSYSLSVHIRRAHTQEKKPYKCSRCDSAFFLPGQLKRHIWKCTGKMKEQPHCPSSVHRRAQTQTLGEACDVRVYDDPCSSESEVRVKEETTENLLKMIEDSSMPINIAVKSEFIEEGIKEELFWNS